MLRSTSQRRGCTLVLKALLVCSAIFFLGTALTVYTGSWVSSKVSASSGGASNTIRAETSSSNDNSEIAQEQLKYRKRKNKPAMLPPLRINGRVIRPAIDVPVHEEDDDKLDKLAGVDDQPSTDPFSSADATPLPSSPPQPIDHHSSSDGGDTTTPTSSTKPLIPDSHLRGEDPDAAAAGEVNSEWFDELLQSLSNERLLTKNIKSKEHMWRAMPPPPKMQKRPHALVYLGWVAFWNMEEAALQGGPAGEFVIWGDLVAGMANIGYQLTFVHSVHGFWQLIKGWEDTFDVVITDYDGLGTAENMEHFPKHHCKYYIVDGFGTQPAFNNKRHMDLKRVLTPYPFDEHNTAINVLAEELPKQDWLARENTGVLWAKTSKYLQGKENVLRWVTDVMPLHTSIGQGGEGGALGELLRDTKRFMHHGFTDRRSFLQRMSSSRFLLGVGEPIDGPTAMEAMAQGCVFINAKFTPPVVYDGKPTVRPYTSQHPFVEHYVPEPYAYTIDLSNRTAVDATLQKILAWTPQPYRHQFNTEHYYVANLRKIFGAQSSCTAASPMPSRHPGNAVYSSWDDWKARCGNTCTSHQTQPQGPVRPTSAK